MGAYTSLRRCFFYLTNSIMKKHLKYVYAILAAVIVGVVFRYFDNDFIGGWMSCLSYLEILKYYRDKDLLHCVEELEKEFKTITKR